MAERVVQLSDLNGGNGFRLDGIDAYDLSGGSVASAGDVNGDGFDDLVIGAFRADPDGREDAGETYVVFGYDAGFAPSLSLAALDGSNGFRLDGIDERDFSGGSVASVGDVNGDGFDDLVIGAVGADPDGRYGTGETYVVFGSNVMFAPSLSLAALDGSNGFRLGGIEAGEASGGSVASAGDVNGDGFDDLVIGAFPADPDGREDAGETYVVFGSDAGFAPSLSLAALDGSNGFRLDGIDAGDWSGDFVASAGDVNGDGFDDLAIGAFRADPDGREDAGETYVVFGSDAGFAPSLSLGALDGSNGFRLDGIDAIDWSGRSVASAGDVNGDGFDDLVIGANGADPDGRDRAGETYVVFGSDAGFAPSLSLGALDGSNGFRLDGIDAEDLSGVSVASAGDVNGDGFDDLVIGAYGADPDGRDRAGETYVVFGSDAGFAPSLSLEALNGNNGFRLDGIDTWDRSGNSVASAGDVNGDGFDDLVIGAYGAGPDGRDDAGETYVVFGSATIGQRLSITGTEDGDVLTGTSDDEAIDALGGNDWITPGAGADAVDGGAGIDMVSYADQAGPITVIQDDTALRVTFVNGRDALTQVEGVTGTSVGDVFWAASGHFRSLGGDDLFRAMGEGRGTYDGGAGLDEVSYIGAASGVSASLLRGVGWGGDAQGDGYTGIENLTGTEFNDALWGDNGNNRLEGLAGDDTLIGNGGDDYILAGLGTDVIVFSGNRAEYRIVQSGIRTEVEHLSGGVDGIDVIGHGEVLRFADGDLALGVTGTGDGDVLTGDDGWFRGFGGDDLFRASGSGNGRYEGGAGTDALEYSASSAGVSASLLRGVGWGGDAQGDRFTGIENMTGTEFNDALWGDNGNNQIEGLAGDDTLIGNGGDDYILAGLGTDVIVFSGNRSEYGITQDGIRTEVEHLSGGIDGIDVIGHGEVLRFADGDFLL